MKKFILLIFLSVIISGCTLIPQKNNKQTTDKTEDILNVNADGSTKFNNNNLQVALDSVPNGSLSKEEEDGLLFMVEEEKLAQDVYGFLYQKWNQQVFGNIGQSESTHVSAVKSLLEKYDINLPTTLSNSGIFVNTDLQKLYNNLTQQGANSLVDALKVGAAVEEIDILDLEKRLKQTDKADIQLIYDNLMRGSRNHLRAFVRNMQNQGHDYQPQYLTNDTYSQIINSANEQGTDMQGGRRRQGN